MTSLATGAAGAQTPPVHTIASHVADPVATYPGFYTFSLSAPTAKAVSVTGTWGLSNTNATYTMAQTAGVWTVLLGPLAPGDYTYSFTVDGVPTKDPANVNVVHSTPALSAFLVPGASASFVTPHAGPKGKLTVLTYHSNVTNTDRSATVWTPPGYSAHRKTPYPTFYLIHGGGGDYLDWVQQGAANIILDNLWAAHKLQPMVVVMVDGNVPGSTGLPQDDTFPTELLKNIVPAVQKHYHVSGQAKNRALAGLSLGGLQVFNTLIDKPGAFPEIGDFSSGYFPPVIDQIKAQDATLLSNKAINKKTKLFRIYIGDPMDIAYTNNILTRQLFNGFGIHYQFAGSYGVSDHDWKTWQHDLQDFAPRLFQK